MNWCWSFEWRLHENCNLPRYTCHVDSISRFWIRFFFFHYWETIVRTFEKWASRIECKSNWFANTIFFFAVGSFPFQFTYPSNCWWFKWNYYTWLRVEELQIDCLLIVNGLIIVIINKMKIKLTNCCVCLCVKHCLKHDVEMDEFRSFFSLRKKKINSNNKQFRWYIIFRPLSFFFVK